MKKITLLAAVIVAASFASCKKNYTCVCTTNNSSNGFAASYTFDLGKIKKGDAKSACDAAGSSWSSIGYTCESKVK
ncbi:MAG: hypothetical protein V4506_14585 [Bacteroidota bacterium]